MYPLFLLQQDVSFNNPISLTKYVLNVAEGTTGTLTNVGIGIASVFLLVVIFVYVSQILDGGKFQVKMLVPLLVYFCVCNFKLVASPVVAFAVAIQEQCALACKAGNDINLCKIAYGSTTPPAGNVMPASIMEAFLIAAENDKDPFDTKKNEGTIDTVEEGIDENGNWFRRTVHAVTNFASSLNDFWEEKIRGPVYESLIGKVAGKVYNYAKYGLWGFVATILNAICSVIENIVTAIGAVMTGVVVAFGPITWAFAVWPGNTKTIGAWALRMCQFALYSPIVCLVSGFFTSLISSVCNASLLANVAFSLKAGGNAMGSLAMLVALMAAMIAVLVAVPAVAGMIIEGAQGYVSMIQGLQTVSSIVSDTRMIGESVRDAKQLSSQETMSKQLDAIGSKLGADMPPIS